MSVDRALQVGGIVIGLIGGGLVLFYPVKWIGLSSIGLGILIIFAAIIWTVASRHAIKEYKAQQPRTRSSAPAQALTQTGIANAPHNEFKPSSVFNPQLVLGTPARVAPQRREVQRHPSVFEATDNSRIETYGFDAQTGHLIRERYEGNEADLPDRITIVNVVLAQFYYRPDQGVEPYLYVSAHVFVYNSEGKPLKPLLYNTAWDNQDLDSSMDFYAGKVHDLILALVARENPKGIVLYEHAMEKITYEGYGSEMVVTPKLHEIEGQDFFIKVELAPKRVNDPILKQTFWFRLTVDPQLELTQIKPPEFAK
jgi:hypothetical protein